MLYYGIVVCTLNGIIDLTTNLNNDVLLIS